MQRQSVLKEVPDELETSRYVKYVTAQKAIAAVRNMKIKMVSPRANTKAVIRTIATQSKVHRRIVQQMSDENNSVPTTANTQTSRIVAERERASSSFGVNSSISTARG